MLTDDEPAALEAAWATARQAGVLGRASVQTLWEHTAGYASAVCSAFSAPTESIKARIVDVGTGAGVPGALLAHQLPQAHVTLVDAMERRLDHARRACRVLGVTARTEVVHVRAEVLGHAPGRRGAFDVAVSRLLAEPADALELLLPLVVDGGLIVISTSAGLLDRWQGLPTDQLPVSDITIHGDGEYFVSLRRTGDVAPALPRSPKARGRSPLFG